MDKFLFDRKDLISQIYVVRDIFITDIKIYVVRDLISLLYLLQITDI